MKKRMIPAALLLLSAAAPAFSQSLSALPLRNPHQIPDGYISVQSGISLSIPITDGNDEKQQQDAIKSFVLPPATAPCCSTRSRMIARSTAFPAIPMSPTSTAAG
ncbi:hypothetical protein FHT86_001957 [Rhizobium sp. BK313]|nr:hypothetical protein [Rhizobium sp. BK313]